METNHDELIELLTPDEVGKALKVTGRTILKWEAQGVIEPAIRVGKVIRFNLAHVKGRLAAATNEAIRLKQVSALHQSAAQHPRSEVVSPLPPA